ncbi:MAG: BTAD domain-containing putative transcriptional regulator [Gemmatimonadales bacterium]|jgi:DNA-binding SARP family transcriptional activator
MPSESFYLVTLGQLSLRASGPTGREVLPSSKPAAILALLATLPGATANRDYLADLLWPGADHSHARSSLRQALFQLSKRASPDLVEADSATLSLNRDLLRVDLWAFDRAMEAGDYGGAVELWHGPFLAGFERKLESELAHWAEAQNERIRPALEVAYARLVGRALREEETERAVHFARKYARDFQLHDVAQVTLIQTLRAVGKDVEALRSYEAYRQLLRDELGDVPGEELEEAAAAAREALLAPLGEATRAAARALANNGGELGASGVSRPRTFVRSILIGGLAGLGVALAILMGLTLQFGGWPLEEAGRGFSAEIPVITRSGDVAAVVVRDDDVAIEMRDTSYLAQYRIASPDGERLALPIDTEGGLDIAVTNIASGDTSVVVAGPEDELPRQWSPDGSCLLYVYGVPLDGGRDYGYRLGILELASGAHRPLSAMALRSAEGGWGVWSPDGTRIAFSGPVGDEERVFVVNVDGSDLLPVSPAGESASEPAWSPEGLRLAFAMGRRGERAVYVVRADGGGLERVTTPVGDARSPIWISSSGLAFFWERVGTPDLRMIDLRTGRDRGLTADPTLSRILPNRAYPAGEDGGVWIENLRITPAVELLSPGQHLSLEVEASDAGGHGVPTRREPIRWSVSDTSIARLDGPGRVEVRDTGEVEIVASAGGWRADTLWVQSRPLVETEIEPVFVEDWTRGVRPERFIVYGVPLPFSRASGGPEGGGVFVSNGDGAFTSGAVTREAYPLAGGLTVEVWGRLPFTGNHWEDFSIGLFSRLPPGDSLDWRDGMGLARVAGFQVHGHDRVVRVVLGSTNRVVQTTGYFPTNPDRWSLYALQVETDGALSIVQDGRLCWRSAELLPLDSVPRAHVGLGYASRDTEIMHGELRIYLGTKYVIAGPR